MFKQSCAIDCRGKDDCYSFQFKEDTGECHLGGFYDHRFLEDVDGDPVFIDVAGMEEKSIFNFMRVRIDLLRSLW